MYKLIHYASLSAKKHTGNNIDINNQELIQNIAAEFNDSLKFDSALPRMAYTVRDPVVNSKHLLL